MDDRECSGKPQDTCSSAFELSIVQIGLETYRDTRYENELRIDTVVGGAVRERATCRLKLASRSRFQCPIGTIDGDWKSHRTRCESFELLISLVSTTRLTHSQNSLRNSKSNSKGLVFSLQLFWISRLRRYVPTLDGRLERPCRSFPKSSHFRAPVSRLLEDLTATAASAVSSISCENCGSSASSNARNAAGGEFALAYQNPLRRASRKKTR